MGVYRNNKNEMVSMPIRQFIGENGPGNSLVVSTLLKREEQIEFFGAIMSEYTNNPSLQRCDMSTVITAGLKAFQFDVPFGMGYIHFVPYEEKQYNPQTKKRETIRVVCTIQYGWRLYVQLAQRTGLYKKIGVREVHKGEMLNILDEYGEDMIKFDHKYDNEEVVGYLAYFELLNGFSKTEFWTVDKVRKHADKYSQAYSIEDEKRLKEGKVPASEMYKFSSPWYTNFDAMAFKTVLVHLIRNFGPISKEMRDAMKADQSYVDENGKFNYVDNSTSEETKNKTIVDVKDEQEEKNATVIVNENGEVKETKKPTTPKVEEPIEEPDDMLQDLFGGNE